jgi:predicted nucleic acid-binding protein
MSGTIADTTVLNNFAQVRRPDLLKLLFSPLAAPASVLEELDRGVRSGLVPRSDWSWLDVVSPGFGEIAHAAELLLDLESGESGCIAVAKARW